MSWQPRSVSERGRPSRGSKNSGSRARRPAVAEPTLRHRAVLAAPGSRGPRCRHPDATGPTTWRTPPPQPPAYSVAQSRLGQGQLQVFLEEVDVGGAWSAPKAGATVVQNFAPKSAPRARSWSAADLLHRERRRRWNQFSAESEPGEPAPKNDVAGNPPSVASSAEQRGGSTACGLSDSPLPTYRRQRLWRWVLGETQRRAAHRWGGLGGQRGHVQTMRHPAAYRTRTCCSDMRLAPGSSRMPPHVTFARITES